MAKKIKITLITTKYMKLTEENVIQRKMSKTSRTPKIPIIPS